MGEEGVRGRWVRYEDFEVEVGVPTLGELPIAVLHSPAGKPRTTAHLSQEALVANPLTDSAVSGARSPGETTLEGSATEEQSAKEFGTSLFEAVFSGPVGRAYAVSKRETQQSKAGLRVKLRIDDPRLLALPWELLYDTDRQEFVSLYPGTPLVRFVDIGDPPNPIRVALPLRMLAMVASPSDMPPLNIARERRNMETALRPLLEEGLLELRWVEHGRWRELQELLRRGPWHVFHFIGHGEFDASKRQGTLIMCSEYGAAERLSARDVARLLDAYDTLQLVVLNACEGAVEQTSDGFTGAALSLVGRSVPAVVAMQHRISDRAAIEFSRSFYASLADELPVDAAVTEARKTMSIAAPDTIEWATPVLYMRSPDGVLFEMPGRRDASSAPPTERGTGMRGPAMPAPPVRQPGGPGRARSIRAALVIGIAVAVLAAALVLRSVLFRPSPGSVPSSTGSAATGPVLPAGDGSIVFLRTIDGATSVWSTDPQGSHPRVIVPDSERPQAVRWLPDGRIAFVEGQEWILANADGTGQRPFAIPQDATSWDLSPDGRHLVFSSREGQCVCVSDLDGTGRVAILTFRGARYPHEVAWSPTGDQLSYVFPEDLPPEHLMVVGIDPTLHATGKPRSIAELPFGYEWSPSGREIAASLYDRSGGSEEIFVIEVGRGTPRRVTQLGSPVGSPTWSPDAMRIAFDREVGPSRQELWIVRVDRQNPRAERLLEPPRGASDARPSWGLAAERGSPSSDAVP